MRRNLSSNVPTASLKSSTPHIPCTFATREILPVEYVEAALTYYVETKSWDSQYVARLRGR